MKKSTIRAQQRATEKAARVKYEERMRVATALEQERKDQQRRADLQFVDDFFRAVGAATELSDDVVLMACIYVGGGYRDLKIPMASIRHLNAVVGRLSRNI